ncbi:MAG: hypothetical protein JXA71_10195, partial [Chitinispirillaceae bacterium]|nr:hypothetical protein [Chitinispirillaceae bacterium]
RFFSARSDLPQRLYLHAWQLVVPHPSTGKPLRIKAPLPTEFRTVMERANMHVEKHRRNMIP